MQRCSRSQGKENVSCEEKFNCSHVCKNKQFQVMLLGEDDIGDDTMREDLEGRIVEGSLDAQVSFHV